MRALLYNVDVIVIVLYSFRLRSPLHHLLDKTIRNLENIAIFVPESKVFITLIYQTRNYEHHRNQRH
jgi:hypothetical protein